MPNLRKEAKACKVCGEVFKPFKSTQKVCSPGCAVILARDTRRAKEAKERRKIDRDRLEAIQPLGHWHKKAQEAFNAFIRIRDEGRPCISCGAMKPHTCGHQLSVASTPELRYDTRNANGQCSTCNSGNAKYPKNEGTIKAKYEAGVLFRFGPKRMAFIRSPHPIKQYREEDLKRIAAIFKKRAKIYKKMREIR